MNVIAMIYRNYTMINTAGINYETMVKEIKELDK